jgi:hypothetical protein
MDLLKAIVLFTVTLSADTLSIGNKTEQAIVVDKLDIAPAWAGDPVPLAILTQPPDQFIAYYDADRQMTVVQRNLNERTWITTKLGLITDWDAHKYITMAMDDDGYLHLCGNLHVTPLIYFRTAQSRNASTFVKLDRMVGTNERRTTYPIFFRGPENEFIFTYRDGMSGNGNQIYDIYDVKTKTWKRLLDQPLTDGEGKRNAYFNGPILGPDGYFHLTWVWRESGDCSSNHDLSYARSKDLLSWETSTGKPLKLPIVFAISFGPLNKENDGTLTQKFYHVKFGNGTWAIDPETLRATGTVQRETIPPSLLKVEGTFPGLGARFVEDSGKYNVADTRFIIRWESLEGNGDRPIPPPYPSPSMLRVYAIKVLWNNTSTNP